VRDVLVVAVEVSEAHGAAAGDEHARRGGVRDHGEVGPFADRLEVCGRRALAAHVALRDVVEADAVLHGAVEVGVVGEPGLLPGADEGLAERVVLHLLGDVHRPAAAVVLVHDALVVLHATEVRQHAVIAPALVAE